MNQLIKKKKREKRKEKKRCAVTAAAIAACCGIAIIWSGGRRPARVYFRAPAQRGLIINVEWRRARNLKTFLRGVLSAGSLWSALQYPKVYVQLLPLNDGKGTLWYSRAFSRLSNRLKRSSTTLVTLFTVSGSVFRMTYKREHCESHCVAVRCSGAAGRSLTYVNKMHVSFGREKEGASTSPRRRRPTNYPIHFHSSFAVK